MCFILILIFIFSMFWKIKENQVLGILFLFFSFFIYQEVFSKSFLCVSFPKTLLKILEKVRKIALKNLRRNRPRELIFIGFSKYSLRGPEQPQNGLSVNRPVDRPKSDFWGQNERASLYGRLTGAIYIEQTLWNGQPLGRPLKPVHLCAHRSTDPGFGRPVSWPLAAQKPGF